MKIHLNNENMKIIILKVQFLKFFRKFDRKSLWLATLKNTFHKNVTILLSYYLFKIYIQTPKKSLPEKQD